MSVVPPVHWSVHALIWTLYTLLWHSLQSDDFLDPFGLAISASYTLANVGLCYTNLNHLMPRFLPQRRWGAYFGWLAVAFAGWTVMLVLLVVFFFTLAEFDVDFLLRQPGFVSSILGSNFTALLFPMTIRLFQQRRALERRQEELERAQLETELNYLKSQLHPHFLFNALNNIYFLIKRDPDAAAEALAGFSDLLRYQLYRSDQKLVPLVEELEHLQKYAHLAALRKDRPLELRLELPEAPPGDVAPWILLPLLENAFKHLHHDAEQTRFIRGHARVTDQQLQFVLENTFDPDAATETQDSTSGGIGLRNIRRRLALHYPQQHHFSTNGDGTTYRIELQIPLR